MEIYYKENIHKIFNSCSLKLIQTNKKPGILPQKERLKLFHITDQPHHLLLWEGRVKYHLSQEETEGEPPMFLFRATLNDVRFVGGFLRRGDKALPVGLLYQILRNMYQYRLNHTYMTKHKNTINHY